MKFVCALIAVAAALCCANVTASGAGDPGLRVAITNSGLTEFKDIALPLINAAFKDLTLPSMDLQEHVPLLGHITLDLSNMKVTNFHLPDADFAFAPPDSLSADLSQLTLDIGLDYAWRKVHWPHISDHGSVTADPSGVSIQVTLGLTTVDGKPQVTVTSSSVVIDSFTIHFDGKVGWLYNLLVGLFKSTIKKTVTTAIQHSLQGTLGGALNKAFAKLPSSEYLGGGKSRMTVNTSVTDFTFGSDYMSIAIDMGIRDNSTGAACPLTPVQLPPVTPGSAGSMLQMLMDDSFINCALWTSQANGAIHFVLNNKNMPKSSKLSLNTTDWKDLIPALYKEFPNMAMQITIDATEAPYVKTSVADGMLAQGNLALNFSVVQPTGVTVHAFELDALLNAGVDLSVGMKNKTAALFPKITALNATIAVTQSSIGPISVAPLSGLLHALLPGVQDVLNLILANGLALPSVDGLSLVTPTIDFAAGFFAIATDFTFS